MRQALAGSAMVHAALLGAALLAMAWPEPEADAGGETVAIELISIEAFSGNETETVTADASETLVSAGASASQPVEAEPVETPDAEIAQALQSPMETEIAEDALAPLPAETPPAETPDETAPAEPPTETSPTAVETSEPLETAALTADTPLLVSPTEAVDALAALPPAATEPLEPLAPEPSATASAEPVASEALAPVSESELPVAPIPATLSFERPTEPTPRPVRQAAQPARERPAEPARQQPRPASSAGNGGQNAADARAAAPSAPQRGSAGTTSSAEAERYPGQVVAKLRRSLRYPSGARGAAGEVHVRFTISAGGSASGIAIARSSGNPALDRAGLETVSRAAPFPPIPPGANRASWAFTVPLAFTR